MEKKLTFQKFTEIAVYEVYKALDKQYDVRNAVLKEVMPQCSAEIAVILVTKSTGLPMQEPCIKKLSFAYYEYSTVYHGNIQEFALAYANEVKNFYQYVDPKNRTSQQS